MSNLIEINWKSVAAATLTLFLAYKVLQRSRPSKNVDKTSSKRIVGSKTILRLSEFELVELIRVPASSTLTFFKGNVSVDDVKKKVISVIKHNPWLVGRLIHSKEFDQVALSYPSEFDAMVELDCFHFVKDLKIKSDMSPAHLGELMEKYIVPPAIECVDKDIPVMQVVLLELNPEKEYALFMSLSHIIADGFTYYSVFNMLDFDTSERPLIVDRFHELKVLDRKLLSDRVMDWFKGPGLILGLIRNALFGKKVLSSAHIISDEAVDQIKKDFVLNSAPPEDAKNGGKEEKAYGQVPFISTNDVITSWFFTTCRSTVALMPMNLRSRLPGLTPDHAGNYERCMLYSREDYTTPAYIRQSITPDSEGRYCTKSGYLPTTMETIWGNLAVVTNWTTFYKDIRITRTPLATPEDIYHRPVYRLKEAVFSDVCVVYKCNQNTTAVNCTCRSADMVQLMKDKSESVKILKNRLY